MAIGSTTSNTQSIGQSIWKQIQMQQAQRTADQAEQNARALQAEASNAQRTADKAQENARSIKVQAEQAQGVASQANMSLEAAKSMENMGVQLSATYTQVAQAQQAALPQAQPAIQTQQPQPVANAQQPVASSQGQTTGTVVNTTA